MHVHSRFSGGKNNIRGGVFTEKFWVSIPILMCRENGGEQWYSGRRKEGGINDQLLAWFWFGLVSVVVLVLEERKGYLLDFGLVLFGFGFVWF